MDDIAAGEPGRKGGDDSSSCAALTPPPRGPGLLSPSSPSPSGSGPIPSPTSAAVLALPATTTSQSHSAAGLLAPSRLAGEMDGGGGETLLVRRSKGKKKRPQPPAPVPHAERGSGSGSGDRFRTLWRDYHDLLQETEAKKKRLASTKRRSLALLAEVKFLRRKYQSFLKGASQQKHYKLKKRARYMPSPLGINKAGLANHAAGTEVPSTSKNPNLDLNQDSVPNDVGNDWHGQQGHLEVEKFDQVPVDEDMMTADVKLSVCRDTGNSPVSEGKSTVPWQDRLALKA